MFLFLWIIYGQNQIRSQIWQNKSDPQQRLLQFKYFVIAQKTAILFRHFFWAKIILSIIQRLLIVVSLPKLLSVKLIIHSTVNCLAIVCHGRQSFSSLNDAHAQKKFTTKPSLTETVVIKPKISIAKYAIIIFPSPLTLSQRKSIFRVITWNVAGKTWYYAEYFI